MSGSPRRVETDSEEATLEAAARFAVTLSGGSVVHLAGPLGAGKTRFVKGMARGLGLDADEVVSPTFTLVHPHAARAGGLGLVHVDLYRLGDLDELLELGLGELPGHAAIAAIEWAERLPERCAERAHHVTIDDLGGDRRRITIAPPRADGPPTVL